MQASIPRQRAWCRGRHTSLGEAMESFAKVHRRLVAVLTDTPDAVLRRPWHPAYPDTLAMNIARNTYRHYAEHLALLRVEDGSACAAC